MSRVTTVVDAFTVAPEPAPEPAPETPAPKRRGSTNTADPQE